MRAVILCGGKGTRSYPFTEYFPKVMMPVGGAPILVQLMRVYAAQGCTEFVLAAGHRKEMLIDYFESRVNDWNVRIVDTGDETDTGERVRLCAPFVGDRFFVTYGDGLGDVNLHDLVHTHKQRGATVTLTTVPLPSQYGHVCFDGSGQVEKFDEKPVIRDYWINAGFFVFEKRAFDEWDGNNLERDVLPAFARRGELFAYRHMGFWKSLDTSKDQMELDRLAASGNPPWAARELAHGAAK